HALARIAHRKSFQDFLRVFSGRIAQFIAGAVKGSPFGKRFWAPVFTRILEWGKSFLTVKRYVMKNELEATGEISYTPRKPSRSRSHKWRVKTHGGMRPSVIICRSKGSGILSTTRGSSPVFIRKSNSCLNRTPARRRRPNRAFHRRE